MTKTAKEHVTLRINPALKQALEIEAKDRGMGYRQLIEERINLGVVLKPEVQRYLNYFSEDVLHLPIATILEHIITYYWADNEAFKKTVGQPRPLFEFVKTPEGMMEGEELFDTLLNYRMTVYGKMKEGVEGEVTKG